MDNYSEGLATGMALNQGNPGWNCGYGYNNGGFGFGGEWGGLIGLLIVASLFGGNGWGFGGNNRNGSCATQADLAAGFANSEVMSDLNDILLQNSQGFAAVQQTLCQGFSGVNATVNQGFAGVNNAICTLGYQNQAGFNQISNLIQSCCCDLKTMNLENRYLNERQTCDIVAAINAGNQRLVDIYTADKLASKDARIAALESKISNAEQSAYLLGELKECPRAAYIVPNPNCCYDYHVSGTGYSNGCCGNGGF